MKVIEEHRNDLKPLKSHIYIYKCDCCGSILEVNENEIQETWGDMEEYFTCPVCQHNIIVFPFRFHHLKSLKKLFNKKYR